MMYRVEYYDQKGPSYILERSSDEVLFTFPNVNKGFSIVQSLNKGGGFNGWIPDFFKKGLSK